MSGTSALAIVGTAKAATDFVRQYAGVRFLYPDIAPYNPVAAAANVDLPSSPAIEFLPMATIAVPAGLNTSKTPVLRLNTAHPAGGGFYDLAHNRFPRVDEVFGGHTWRRGWIAVTAQSISANRTASARASVMPARNCTTQAMIGVRRSGSSIAGLPSDCTNPILADKSP